MTVHAIPTKLQGSFLIVDGDALSSGVESIDRGLRFDPCNAVHRIVVKTGCRVVLAGEWSDRGIGPESVFGQCLRSTIGKFQAQDVLKQMHSSIEDIGDAKSWIETHKPERVAVLTAAIGDAVVADAVSTLGKA